MKTMKNFLVVWMVILVAGISQVQGQSRGRDNQNGNAGRGNNNEHNPGKGHDKEYQDNRDRDFNPGSNRGRGIDNDDRNKDRDQYDGDRNRHDHHDNRKWNRPTPTRDVYRYQRYDNHHRYITYRHHRNSPPSWAPAYGYRYNTRYIFYQDYNIYYDCYRDVFVVWNGRNWMISHRIPDVMYRVDFGRSRVAGVDYWDDDFDFYLQRRRPAYISIHSGW